MANKKKLAREFATNNKKFDESFPYLNDIEFLHFLEEEYAKMEEYEVCAIINARIKILTSDTATDEKLEHLNEQIRLYKKIKGLN